MGKRFKSSDGEHQIYEDPVCLFDGVPAVVVTGNYIHTEELVVPGNVRGLIGYLSVMPTPGVIGDLLDVVIQTYIDCPHDPVWVDVIYFTQVTAAAALQQRWFSKIAASLDEATFEIEIGAALAAGAERNVIGSKWRIRYDIVNAGTATWDFSVSLHPQ